MCLHALAGALRGPPGVFVHGIFQARILEWVSFSYCRGSSWLRDWTCLSCVSRIGRQVLYHCATWEAPRCTVCCFSKKMLERYARPLNDIVAIFKANPFFFFFVWNNTSILSKFPCIIFCPLLYLTMKDDGTFYRFQVGLQFLLFFSSSDLRLLLLLLLNRFSRVRLCATP